VAAASSSLEHGGGAGQDEVERGSPVHSGNGENAAGGGEEEVIGVRWGSGGQRCPRRAPAAGGRGGVSVPSPDRNGGARGKKG
jgi:hypothetical protein